MSRSVHQNKSRRYWRQHGDHSDADWIAQTSKWRIKRLVRQSRHAPSLPFTPVNSKAIQIIVEDVRPPLFFPVSIADIEEVMDELPPGYLNGVSRVRLIDGEAYINAQESVDGEVFDSTIRRKSIELEPGIYAPIVLGTYQPWSGAIDLFAYSIGQSVQVTRPTELALKMRMLLTLVHELAHNKDCVQRVARGRWRMDNSVKAELYAQKLERVLFDSVVAPYVRRKYGSNAQ